MYREAGARRRIYFNPQTTIYESTVVQCMLVNQCLWSFTMEKVEVATAAKFSVELLNLSVKTYSIYTILVLKHNIHTLYKVSRAHFFRWNNLREAHSKRYTQTYNPKEQLRYARKDQCLFICGEKHDYITCTTSSSQLGTFLWNMTVGYIRRF